ncbi:heterokaryon incompatibility protein-domain-containing protein [Phyllosticta capitalensis]
MSTVSPSQYQHAELATASTIRLIKLQEQKVDGTVACALQHLDIAEQPDFEYYALSYVWGDATPTRYVYVGKLQFLLHERLWCFLDWAWNRKLFDRWIWTDRICLNQEDSSEIAQQVPRMGEIFHKAKQVMAWLGMSESEGDCLIDVLDWQPTHKLGMTSQDRDQFSRQAKRLAHAAWCNEYWERVWIVQEVLNAKSLVVLIGNVETTLQKVRENCSSGDRGDNPFLRIKPIELLNDCRECGTKMELGGLLSLMNGSWFHCRRPQDRIYGCLGFVASRTDGTSPIDFIQVNYNRSYPEVLLDAILESQPPIGASFGQILGYLLPGPRTTVNEPIFDLFKRYLESDQTSDRHKKLAGYVLEACDAFIKILLLSGSSAGCFWFVDPFNGPLVYHRTECTPTLQEEAAILGFMIGAGSREEAAASTFENWKACRQPHISTQSPWRCAAHSAYQGPKSTDKKNSPHAEAGDHLRGEFKSYLRTFCLQPRHLAKVCGEYSCDAPQLCDASIMTLEMLEGGFRVIFRQLPKAPRPEGSGPYFPANCSCREFFNEELRDYVWDESFFGEMIFQFLDTETDPEGKGNNQHGN